MLTVLHTAFGVADWLAGVSLTTSPCVFQFFGFLLVIFAIEIAAAVWGYTHKDEVGVFQ